MHEVASRRYQCGTIVTDELVAALAVLRADIAGEGEDLTVVAPCHTARDESATLCRTLDEYRGIGTTGYNAVAAHEVLGERLGVGHVFGEESALLEHVDGCLPVGTGVDVVESVG